MTEKVVYSIAEFCEVFAVGKSFTFEQIAADKLLTRKAGRKTLILKTDAEAWLNALPQGKAA
jgi:hypothetical protein